MLFLFIPLKAFLGCLLLSATFSLSILASAEAEDRAAVPDASNACASPEECFRSAFPPRSLASGEERRRLQIERFKLLRQQFPESPWVHRAGVMLGVLFMDRDPSEAVRLLEAARQPLPILEDYLRFWQAEALVRAGEVTQGAVLFDSIQQVVPDTVLQDRIALASGQAWYKAGDCKKATDLLLRGIAKDPQNPSVPSALLNVADCQFSDSRPMEGRATLKQVWVKYPHTASSREALSRLNKLSEGDSWYPSADDIYGRGVVFQTLSMNHEAAEEFQKFLGMAPKHPRRDEAKLKLGTALVRLKRYDQARSVFQDLLAQHGDAAAEAAVSLARVYLRQGDGERLLSLRQSLPTLTLSVDQRASVLTMTGLWFEDQARFDDAIAAFREAALLTAAQSQRTEALWRVGWIHYYNGQWRDAVDRFQEALAGKDDPQWTPQLLYWRGRALDRLVDPKATEAYQQVCRQYALTYYCQLVRNRIESVGAVAPFPAAADNVTLFRAEARQELAADPHYQKAVELKILKQEQDAAKELALLTERYSRDRGALLALAARLSEAGAHYEALRIARVNFRESLERGGDPVPQVLWNVAYPTVYMPTIRIYAGRQLDPFLAAAIIREESQYDARAVSRVGALGLMQLMPDTAKAVAHRLGGGEVVRDDLFDQGTNIRYGTGYLDQLLEQFSGNIVYTVAAYNAGPPAVQSWIAKRGGRDQEEFVEMIPYQETRQYVKRVLRSYREYRRLAGEPCPSRPLDKVC